MWQVQIIGDNDDPIFFLCGRCTSNPASEKYFMTPRSFCVPGAICSMPSGSSRDLDPGVACDSTYFFVWQASEKFC